jgi:polyphosphate kinase
MPSNHSPFINRELSWLEFNGRVLDEAADPAVPLLDRLKFLAIFSNNLDEFFMVRVAGLRRQFEDGDRSSDPAGLRPSEQLARIRRRVLALHRRQYELLQRQVLPGLEERRLAILRVRSLDAAERQELHRHFLAEVLPVLTPVAVDPSHPFPLLSSGTLELAISLRRPDDAPHPVRAFVEVPRVLPRFVPVRGPQSTRRGTAYVLLEDLIMTFIGELFPRCEVLAAFPFRVTRDMDFSIDEEGVDDLVQHLRDELRHRKTREAIRVELPAGQGGALVRWLLAELELGPAAVYTFPGPLNLADLFSLVERERQAGPLEPEWPPLESPLLQNQPSLFAAIAAAGAIPLFHPFESFDPVVRLLEEAAADPAVLAIKQTLYRVSGGSSPVVAALRRAAENGKQVTVIVEVRARFDEERNLQWARSLEASGAHVIYGIVGLKVHAKALLIIRREEGRIRRYLHLATGNYNDRTARVYTDIGMFLTDPDLCMDAAALFNLMTGYAQPPAWRRIAVAPFGLRQAFLELIDREARLSTPHQPGRIIAKMNSLVDPEIIDHLILAARARVRIDLIVRGICCLRPGGALAGQIRVKSIVDRFLEHSRVYYFANGGRPEYYLSSADWMQRNLDRRIELLFPVDDPATCDLLGRLLQLQLEDRRKGRWLRADGSYSRCGNRFNATRSQRRTYDLFRARLDAARRPASGRAIEPRRTLEDGT